MQPAELDLLRSRLTPPAVVVDLDAFDANTRTIAGLAAKQAPGRTVRVATKSLRVPDLIDRVLAFGPPYRGVLCYAARELELLAERGVQDLLLAYPTQRPLDLEAIARVLDEKDARVAVVVDRIEGAEIWARAVRGAARTLSLVVELDVSLRLLGGRVHLGARRSPVRAAEDAAALARAIAAMEGVRFGGVMAYEGQIAGVADRNPFARLLNPAVRWVRRRSRRVVARLRERCARALADAGLPAPVFNAGGTGSLGFGEPEPWVTELTAGSGFLCPHYFDYFSNLRLSPACFYALQVVRSSDPGFVTCQGGGFVASGDPGWHRVPRPWYPPGLELVRSEGAGEVQTPLRVPEGIALAPGDVVFFRHAKAGELAEHFPEYLLARAGEVVGTALTYRGLGKSFP